MAETKTTKAVEAADQAAEEATAEKAGADAEIQEEPELSKTAKQYQEYFKKGFWNKKMLKNMVKKGKITPKEYQIITGECYK